MRVNARRLLALMAFALAGAAARAAAPPAAADAASAPVAEVRADCPAPATAPKQDEIYALMRNAVDRGPLWKATKDGRVVYLYGTIHVAKRDWMFPGMQVLRAVMASDVVALELDLTDPDVIVRLQKAILRKSDSPTLPAALEQRLEGAMAAACVTPATLATLRPEMQAVTLETYQGRRFGLYPDYGIDLFLGGMAKGMKKPIRSLETPELQAGLLVSDDPAETAQTVGAVLDELEGGKSPLMLQRMAGDWERGDLADLDAYASWCECMDTPRQREDFHKLIDERNPLMADKIVQWTAEGKSPFVAAGTLHMVGRIGLPELLRARGFQVERVVFADAPKPQ